MQARGLKTWTQPNQLLPRSSNHPPPSQVWSSLSPVAGLEVLQIFNRSPYLQQSNKISLVDQRVGQQTPFRSVPLDKHLIRNGQHDTHLIDNNPKSLIFSLNVWISAPGSFQNSRTISFKANSVSYRPSLVCRESLNRLWPPISCFQTVVFAQGRRWPFILLHFYTGVKTATEYCASEMTKALNTKYAS